MAFFILQVSGHNGRADFVQNGANKLAKLSSSLLRKLWGGRLKLAFCLTCTQNVLSMQNKHGNKPCLNSCVILANDKHVSKATYHHNLNWWGKLSHPMEREAITTEEAVYLFLNMQLIVSPINMNTQTVALN